MDEDYISHLIKNSPRLKYKFGGIYPADKFPILIPNNTFVIVNSENSNSTGKHWIVWSNVKGTFNFADPLGLDLFLHYPNIAKRISAIPIQVQQTLKDATKTPLQNQNSNLCGLYCIYIAHFLLSSYYPYICYISETDLLRFVKTLM